VAGAGLFGEVVRRADHTQRRRNSNEDRNHASLDCWWRMEMREEGMNGKKEEYDVRFGTIEDVQKTTKGEILTCLDILRDKKGYIVSLCVGWF
jgi:hypothetical protein